MTRPAAITAAAVVATLGSVMTAFFAVTMIYISVSPTLQASMQQHPIPGWYKGLGVATGLCIAAMAAWGIATAIGLFRLRGWARISILIFAGLLGAMSLILGAATFTVAPPPPPAGMPAASLKSFKIVMGVMYAVPALIAAWWLVQFSGAHTRASFDLADPPTGDSGRPLSMSIIGWFLVVGGAFALLPAVAGFPGFVVGAVFTGWSARLWYAAFGIVQVYAGAGLLRLRERGRLVAIFVYCLGLVNGLVIWLMPGAFDRALATERAQLPQLPQLPPTSAGAPTYRMTMIGVLLALVTLLPLWFLIRRRSAFRQVVA